MTEGAFFASLAAGAVTQSQRALGEAQARIAELERALAFERAERERTTARLLEMGHLMITAQSRVAALQVEVASKESAVRQQLLEEFRARVAEQADAACEARVRELNDLLGDGRHPVASRSLGPRQVVEAREMVLGAFEDARMIARRGL